MTARVPDAPPGGTDGRRRWVYAQGISGRFQRVHRWSGRILLAFLVGVPWLSVAGHPAVQFDIPGRRVYALGAVFTTADGFLLALFGFLAAFSLFLFTSLFGRLWCGYACPQTVFLEEFARPIERWVEGDRAERKARDEAPWTAVTVARKVVKLGLFAAVAVGASASFVSWFAGAHAVWTGHAGLGAYSVIAAFAAVWFFDLAWFREQLCNYLCPYARFQGALCDDESLVVRYDALAGEPRRPGKAALAANNCIDCKKCVNVCPQGIDIRDGFQLECVMCGRCIDACDSVLGKAGKKPLIGYGAGDAGGVPRLVRPRTVAYGALVSAAAAGIVAMVALHSPVEASVARSPGPLWTVDDDGWTRNTFLLDVTNNDGGEASVTYDVRVAGLPEGAEVVVPELTLASLEHRRVPLVIRVPPDVGSDVPRTVPVEVIVHSPAADVVKKTHLKMPRS